VVIGDDRVDAEGAQIGDRSHRRRAVVDADHERRSASARFLDRVRAERVAVGESIRDVPLRASTEHSEEPHEQRRSRDAVDVVVAVHEDRLALRNRPRDPRRRGFHAGEQRRVVQHREPRLEVCARLFRFDDAARDEQRARHLARAQRARERHDALAIDAAQRPTRRSGGGGHGASTAYLGGGGVSSARRLHRSKSMTRLDRSLASV
jgi:hypothetical protein